MTLAAKPQSWWVSMIFICLAILPSLVDAYHISVRNVECLSEYVATRGDMVSGNFVVLDKYSGRYFERDDIEMVISDPSGRHLLNKKARGGQKFQFKATEPGYHQICFTNPTAVPEKVDFAIHVGHIPNTKDLAKDEHFNPLEVMVAQVKEAVEKVSLEQQYYRAREVRHRITNESTQSRLLWYTLAVQMGLITCSVAQVYFVQRLFSKSVGYNRV
ncbi:unnamed protein product [Calypogeia fissa]